MDKYTGLQSPLPRPATYQNTYPENKTDVNFYANRNELDFIREAERKKNTIRSGAEKLEAFLVQNGQRQWNDILSPEPRLSPSCQLQISQPEGRGSLTCFRDRSPTRLTQDQPHFYGCGSSWRDSFPGTPRSFSCLPLPQRYTAILCLLSP